MGNRSEIRTENVSDRRLWWWQKLELLRTGCGELLH